MRQLLTVPEVAARIRMSRWGVYALIRSGRLPAVQLRPGGRILVDESALERLLSEHVMPQQASAAACSS